LRTAKSSVRDQRDVRPLTVIGVLHGSVVFVADIRARPTNWNSCWRRAISEATSPGITAANQHVADLAGRCVLVDDIATPAGRCRR
jgi:hypoxanthine-guanine phosphoribosyltransferase